eukprot:1433619-Rhodomonas_salina.1
MGGRRPSCQNSGSIPSAPIPRACTVSSRKKKTKRRKKEEKKKGFVYMKVKVVTQRDADRRGGRQRAPRLGSLHTAVGQSTDWDGGASSPPTSSHNNRRRKTGRNEQSKHTRPDGKKWGETKTNVKKEGGGKEKRREATSTEVGHVMEGHFAFDELPHQQPLRPPTPPKVTPTVTSLAPGHVPGHVPGWGGEATRAKMSLAGVHLPCSSVSGAMYGYVPALPTCPHTVSGVSGVATAASHSCTPPAFSVPNTHTHTHTHSTASGKAIFKNGHVGATLVVTWRMVFMEGSERRAASPTSPSLHTTSSAPSANLHDSSTFSGFMSLLPRQGQEEKKKKKNVTHA